MSVQSRTDDLQELAMLRHEYKAAMTVTSDPDEKWRLYRTLQELNACIERIQQPESR